jgi:hypothetical protein
MELGKRFVVRRGRKRGRVIFLRGQYHKNQFYCRKIHELEKSWNPSCIP